jgi:hypothetical protein
MPGGDRAAYAAHVLSPLKALVTDLRELLSDVRPPLGSEARAGAGLDWPDGKTRSDPEGCPVRRIRFWDAGRHRDSSPLLYVTFTADHLEVGAVGPGVSSETAESLLPRGASWDLQSGSETRVSRRIPWEPWLDEPGLLQEIADDFRSLLPVFDRMRGGATAAVTGGNGPAPRER